LESRTEIQKIFRKLFQVFVSARDRQAGATRAEGRSTERLIADCHELMSERVEFPALASPPRYFPGIGREHPSPETLAKLQRVVEPPRQELFRRLNVAPYQGIEDFRLA